MLQYLNRRILTVLLMGFASGLPLALTTATLTAWYTEAGVSLIGIGALSLVGQPYVYKFIWAPFMDRFVPPLWGRRRGWILITQLCLIVALFAIAWLSPQQHAVLMGFVALLIAFFSASQDVAINAYQTEVLHEDERALGASMYVLGYRIALMISGALALVMAEAIGWRETYIVMSLLMLIGVLSCWAAPEISPERLTPPRTLYNAFIHPFTEFFARKGWKMAVLLMLVIVLYKFGDAFALSLNTAFLLRGVHFSLTDVGVANKAVGLVATIIGGLIGGILLTRLSLFRGLLLFGVLQAVSNLSYMWLAHVGHNYPLMLFAITSEYFCSGLGTSAFLAMVMSLCHSKYTATQFAAFTALSAVGRVYIGPFAAILVDHVGWTWFYFWSFIIALPGTLLIFAIRSYLPDRAPRSL